MPCGFIGRAVLPDHANRCVEYDAPYRCCWRHLVHPVLRQRGRKCIFVAPKSARDPVLRMVTVEKVNRTGASAIVKNLKSLPAISWEGVSQRALLAGKTKRFRHGFERLTEYQNLRNRCLSYRYDLIFKLARSWLYFIALGENDARLFHDMCTTVVSSIAIEES